MSVDPRRTAGLVALWGLAAIAALAQGCGDGPGGVEVSGAVERSGVPLSSGSVLFQPEAGGDAATSHGAVIAGGRYTIPAESGLRPGRYRVEVLPALADGEPEPGRTIDPITGADVPILGAPARPGRTAPRGLSRRREFTVDVTGRGPNTFDFRIQDQD